ncbi:MAG: RNA methyltransferase [Dehalococcoidia bacterium]
MYGERKSLKPLKWYKALATVKGRESSGAFLIEGDRAVRQIIAGHPDSVVEILTMGELAPVYSDYPGRLLTESQFKSICLTKTPQGPLAVIRMPDDVESCDIPIDAGDRILLLEDIQDPGNVGSLIRSAAAFGYSGVVMSDKCADPFSPKCVQSTAGAVLSLWIRRTASYLSIIVNLKSRGYSLIATVLTGEDTLSVIPGSGRIVLALGNEADGLSMPVIELSNYRCKVPIHDEHIESLNVAACGAICMYVTSAKPR